MVEFHGERQVDDLKAAHHDPHVLVALLTALLSIFVYKTRLSTVLRKMLNANEEVPIWPETLAVKSAQTFKRYNYILLSLCQNAR